jgi:hypothetical protein
MNKSNFIVETLYEMQEKIQTWWQGLGFSEFSTETAAIAQSSKGYFKTQLKFSVDGEAKSEFLTEGEGCHDVFVIDNLDNRSLFLKKLKERFPSAAFHNYESFPIYNSKNFRLGSAEVYIYFQDLK